MGFDVSGISPKNEKGEYFRNNIWWWRRLWDFCRFVAAVDPGGEGHMNDGFTVKGKEHTRLKKALKYALTHQDEYIKWVKESEIIYTHDWGELNGGSGPRCEHPWSWQNVAEFYDFVDNNKGFRIW
jgi:hypothetical protein